jgi:hypothetical protein
LNRSFYSSHKIKMKEDKGGKIGGKKSKEE